MPFFEGDVLGLLEGIPKGNYPCGCPSDEAHLVPDVP